MKDSSYIIREILPEDNLQIRKVIRDVFIELELPLEGTAYADSETEMMYESYQNENERYFVIDFDGHILGGGGIKPLNNGNDNTCELQKMYFLPPARGLGIGSKMIDLCLNKAREFGYEQCYIETMSYMEAAQKLYKRYGFEYLEGPIGDTGHYSCGVHMLLDL